MLSNTFHFENNCPWGICSCAVCVVLDKVPSRGLSFAWHSLLGVGVSRHVMKSTCFTLLDVPHYIHFVEELLCHSTLDESMNHVESRTTKSSFVFMCELKQGLIVCFQHFRTSFICFLCSFIHSPPRFIHVPSAFIRFQTVWTGSYFHLFSSFFQTHVLKISFLNVPSAISRRSQVVLVLISVSIYVRPISGHHHHTIHWFLTIHGYPWLSSGFGAVRAGAMGKELQSDLTNISNQ